MSGFAGILHFDDVAPCDRVIERLVDALRFRGPDATGVWRRGPVVLGHTLLRTDVVHPRERQPATVDGRMWIVGDIRVDARDELRLALRAAGSNLINDATDAELVLLAYSTWSEHCVEYLMGDFAFAIWDTALERLFCARDQMGIRPFYYAFAPGQFIFGNTIDSLRRHPDVRGDLNELAIADFLLFGCNLDFMSTAFEQIKKLPPAHVLVVAKGKVDVRRYWTMPIDEPSYFRRPDDYVDRFRELLATAVRDRLRTDRIAVLMSGGLDSTLLAAEARTQLAIPTNVSAFTYVYDRLIADDERHYAGLVAKHLAIRIRFWPLDDTPGTRIACDRTVCPPEPAAEPEGYAEEIARYQEMASQARVAFYGEGPDNALHYEWQPYLRYLRHNGRWGRAFADIARHVVAHRRIPLIPTIPAMFRARRLRKALDIPFPNWLNADFVRRYELRDRWDGYKDRWPSLHPVRPSGYRSMGTPFWIRLFDSLDAGYTRSGLVFRHPYLDLRLLRFLLAVPAMPWCRIKLLLRRSARGVLPRQIVARSKAPLAANPRFSRSRGFVTRCTPTTEASFARFVDPTRLPGDAAYPEFEYTIAQSPFDLHWWLHREDWLARERGTSKPFAREIT